MAHHPAATLHCMTEIGIVLGCLHNPIATSRSSKNANSAAISLLLALTGLVHLSKDVVRDQPSHVF